MHCAPQAPPFRSLRRHRQLHFEHRLDDAVNAPCCCGAERAILERQRSRIQRWKALDEPVKLRLAARSMASLGDFYGP